METDSSSTMKEDKEKTADAKGKKDDVAAAADVDVDNNDDDKENRETASTATADVDDKKSVGVVVVESLSSMKKSGIKTTNANGSVSKYAPCANESDRDILETAASGRKRKASESANAKTEGLESECYVRDAPIFNFSCEGRDELVSIYNNRVVLIRPLTMQGWETGFFRLFPVL